MATGFQLTPEELRIIAENGSPRDQAAAASGRFAQTFNQSIANQGVRTLDSSGRRTAASDPRSTTNKATKQAPPKANAAPSVNKNLAQGLMESLNAHEAELIKNRVWEVANKYSVEFAPAALGDARVTKFGKADKAKVPMQQSKNPADAVNPDSNSVAYDFKTQIFPAGTPILVIMDEILKNSTYIADQARAFVDQVSGLTKQQKPLGNLVWYKISVGATPIEPFDKKRDAYAQNIKYVISAYPINSMQSEYFPECNIRGRHKSYKYWFTGQNTQVLSFEQKFNSLYGTTFTNPDELTTTRIAANTLIRPRLEYQAAVSGSNSQGAEKNANSVGASAADYLYNKSDLGKVNLTIVGDPAWIQQGELAHSLDAASFNFDPFNPDGSINYDAQEIVFDIQWNPGVDYDLTGTGLANPNVSEKPQAVYTYKASTVVSKFSKGKFTQDIEGTFIDLVDLTAQPAVADANQTNAETARLARQNAAAGVRPSAIATTFAKTLPSTVTNPTPASPLAKGGQQILTPVTNGVNLTDAELRNTPIYNQARRGRATDAQALAAARSTSAAGTNNYSGSALPGIRVPNQLIVKDQ